MTTRRVSCGLMAIMSMLIFLPQASAASPTMALDGVAKFGCSCDGIASASVMLTTTHSNDVIVVIAQCGFAGWCDDNISSIVDGGDHVWTLRLNYRPYPNGRPVWEYYTVADTPLSLDVITVTWSGAEAVWFVAFGVDGANVRHPWDSSQGLPAARVPSCISNNSAANYTVCTGTFSVVGAQDFVLVTTPINDDQACQFTSPFQNLNAFDGAGETDFLITRIGGSNSVAFTCNNTDPVFFLADAIHGPRS